MSDFNETWIFSTDFRRKSEYKNFMEICPVGAELFRSNGQTDMTKLIIAFCNFAKAPKKEQTIVSSQNH